MEKKGTLNITPQIGAGNDLATTANSSQQLRKVLTTAAAATISPMPASVPEAALP